MKKVDKKIKIVLPMKISFLDYPDPEFHCVSIYMVGCDHYCPECSNPQLQKYDQSGIILGYDDFEKKLEDFSKVNKTNKVVFLGGDPFYFKNIEIVKYFLKKNKKKYDICIYTGQDIDFVIKNKISGFKFIKCGKYNVVQKQVPMKTNTDFILASKNQQLFDGKYNILSNYGMYKFKEGK